MKKSILLITFLCLIFQITAQNLMKVTSANLNFRTEPKIEKNVIRIIPKGTLLIIDYTNQEFSSWIKFTYKGKTGFSYYKYLKNPELQSNYKWKTNSSNNGAKTKYYINSKGEKVQSPTYYKSPPAGATAECRDGTYSFSRSRRGTCSHHGGVKRWLK